MAAQPIGTNMVTALSRRYIVPDIADNVYNSNALFYRLNAANRKQVQGGTQIEVPLMYSKMNAHGFYQGYDVLNTAPSDTIQNAAFNWKQAYTIVSVDGLTLLKMNSPLAIANFVATQFAQANMQLSDDLGGGLWSDGITNGKSLDGFIGAVDNGTIDANYGGITRAGNTWWQSQVDSSTISLGLTTMQNLFSSVVNGGRHPTIIFSTQLQWNRYWNLNTSLQRFVAQPGGRDEQLAQAGFENILFNGVPWLVDSHIPTTGSQGNLFFLNEDYIQLIVASNVDFKMEDFQTPVDQDAMVAKLLWAGNVVMNNTQLQAKFEALT